MQKTLLGKDVACGSALEVVFDKTVEAVRPSNVKTDVYLSPGWIDVQVNGFAGVDYNLASTPQEEIARSIEVLFSMRRTNFDLRAIL